MKIFVLFLLVFTSLSVGATRYFVSSSIGNDTRSALQAQNELTPWQSLDKVNASQILFAPGDIISFKRGDTFYGALNVTVSGTSALPIIFNAFGTGNLPIFSGLTSITNWQASGNNLFKIQNPASGKNVSQLLINGEAVNPGRYPNLSAAEKGYLFFQSAQTNTTLTDGRLSAFNFSGGDVVIRKTRWVLDRNLIVNQQGGTLFYTSQSGYPADAGFGYFIQNHPATLDLEGEWYFNKNSKELGIFSPGGMGAKNIQVSTVDVLIQLQNQHDITFENITFSGAGQDAFSIKQANNIAVSNCTIVNSGHNAITLQQADHVTLLNNIITQTNNIAIHATGSNNVKIEKNKINNTGVNAGMGDGDSGAYDALLISGNNNAIINNSIENTGYIPITFSGDNVLVKQNFIKHFATVKDDGGGIYTWNNSPNAKSNINRTIAENIIINGSGAPEGTPKQTQGSAHGIYIDDNAEAVNIINNTVANCVGNGLYIHNARNLVISNNTVYNNSVQLLLQHDDIAPNSPVSNIKLNDNTFFSLYASQPVAEFKTIKNDLATFGTFSNNYYCRPADENAIINTLHKTNGSYVSNRVDLEGWKNLYGKDADSKITIKQIAPYTIKHLNGLNQFSNGAFNANSGGLYGYSPANNFLTTWQNNGLDAGTLKLAFNSKAGGANKGTVIIGVGSVTANKSYVVSLSVKSQAKSMIEMFLRKSLAPYNDISDRKLFKVETERKEIQLLFVPSKTEDNASIGIDVLEQNDPVYIDNISIREANVTMTNMEDSVQFAYNETISPKNQVLKYPSIDISGKRHNTQISIAPFRSSITLADNASTAVATAQCSATGTILREQWNNVPGNDIANNNFQNPASNSSLLTAFEGPANSFDQYASRISGFICAPATGNYIFWIAGDDATVLSLSANADPAQKKTIAYNLSWTGFRDWHRYPSQKSQPIFLQAGSKYYIEALQKEGGGGDHLSVAWQTPDGKFQGPIIGNYLSPASITNALQPQTIQFNPLADVNVSAKTLLLSANSSAGLPIQYTVVSGPAVVTGNILVLQQAGTVVIRASQPGNDKVTAALPIVRSLVILPDLSCETTGEILVETWLNVSGNNIWNLDWTSAPSTTLMVRQFEIAQNTGDNFGTRMRGFICAPADGLYTFWIAGDDATELYLSNDATPQNKTRIAYSLSWTGHRELNRFTTQRSTDIYLYAGRKYYIEALQKEGGGGDHLSVGWQLPNGVIEMPIGGNRLSPVKIYTGKFSVDNKLVTIGKPTGELGLTFVLKSNPIRQNGAVTVRLPKTEKVEISLIDVQVRKLSIVFSGKLESGKSSVFPISVSSVKPGVYFLRLTSESQQASRKVIVSD